MKATGKIKTNKVPAGIHEAVVEKIQYARDFYGNIRGTRDGEMGLDIFFQTKHGSISFTAWLTEGSEWIFKNLMKAIGLEGQPDVNEAKGKKLYIMVIQEYLIVNGERKKNKDGEDLFYTHVIPRFFPYFDGTMKPVIDGDPDSNDGIPKGEFIREKRTIKAGELTE